MRVTRESKHSLQLHLCCQWSERRKFGVKFWGEGVRRLAGAPFYFIHRNNVSNCFFKYLKDLREKKISSFFN